MLLQTVIAATAPTIAALAVWRGSRRVPVAWMERIEAKLDDLIDWQVDHERQHKTKCPIGISDKRGAA